MTKRIRFFVYIVVVLLHAAPFAPAQKESELPPETIKQIEALIEKEKTRLHIPGLSVAIATGNQLMYAKGFGIADLENSIPARETTVYRTASIAKSITATGVMRLVEQGKLDLDVPIQKYCSAFPQKQWPVTARQLLAHLNGIRHYKSGQEATGTEHYFAIQDSLVLFKDEPLLHEPGTKYHYTTYGYSVLGCAIEGASGMSYQDYLHKNVFAPADMTATTIDNFRQVIPGRARGYMRLDERTFSGLPEAVKRWAKVDGIYNSSLHDTSMKVPGGGLVSTAVDLVKFATAVNSGKLLKPDSLEMMWTRQKTSDGKEIDYGLGWGIREARGMKLVSHSGGQSGTSTYFVLVPERGIAIAVMCNLQGVGLSGLTGEIGKLLLQQ